MGAKILRSDYTRVWTIENGAGPGRVPVYQGLMRIGDSTYGFGDVERAETPSGDRYGQFDESLEIPGATERPSFSLTGRYPADTSELLRLGRKGCRLDVQLHVGTCQDPRDFNHGWEKIRFYPKARISQYSDENMGALGSDDRNPVNESAELSSADMYEMGRKRFAQKASATTTREVVAIDVCDTASCGDCGDASDGDRRIVALMVGTGGSPGTAPSLLYSVDGGETWSTSAITTMAGSDTPDDLECVGENVVVISNIDLSLSYAPKDDVWDGTAAWTEVSTGFVALKGPNAIVSVSPRATWIVGDGGYVYFSEDPTAGVDVQDAGVATTQNLNDVDAFDDDYAVAVGASNAVVFTENGETWNAVTGPAVGVALNTVLMLDEKTWLVGDAGGDLWYTTNQGDDWTEIGLPITPTAITDLKKLTSTVLAMAATVAGPAGKVLQSIDAGRSWYVLPEGTGNIPANDQIDALGVAKNNPSVLFAAGLADDGATGIIVKAAD